MSHERDTTTDAMTTDVPEVGEYFGDVEQLER